jgi:hypothetical protein
MQQLRERDSDAFVGTDEAAEEFELSAQDLLALSRPGAIQGPTPDAAQSDAAAPVEGPASSQAQTASKDVETPSRDGRAAARRIGLSVSVVVAVVVTGVVLYLYWRPEGAVRSVMGTAPQAAAPPTLSSPTLATEQGPVRFANPFDRTEVFEFPAGTSETEAREAAVEVLMERARDRQSQRNAVSGTHRRMAGITPTEPGKNPGHGASHPVSSPGHED